MSLVGPATLSSSPLLDLEAFALPEGLAATEPPEARALARDEVRLLVATPGRLHHVLFRDIGRFLRAGDLLVVNTSATIPAATDGLREDGRQVVVHFSTPIEDGLWLVELRKLDGSGPVRDACAGERIRLPSAASLTLEEQDRNAQGRLWLAAVDVDGSVEGFLDRWGRPITYGYLRGRWPLGSYQSVFAREPGSAEMPSAARPFTGRLVAELTAGGVVFAPVLLHAGVSSLEAGETPPAERFRVPEPTARLVNHIRASGGRVVAVGTTVTRALETVAGDDGTVAPGEGWTDLVLGPGRQARVVDGLLTGWHSAGASHLDLLRAVAGGRLVQESYAAALEARYLWHEFGDSCLLLPDGSDPEDPVPYRLN
jgi:S-adenosylmethionine:tRNA ribosyltransferase-isomerase